MTGVFIWTVRVSQQNAFAFALARWSDENRVATSIRAMVIVSSSPPIGLSRESQWAVFPARIAGIQHREVAQTAIHGDWVPAIPAGTTGLKELIGGKRLLGGERSAYRVHDMLLGFRV